MEDKWSIIHPQVNSSAEFFEIVNDFGNPLELVREAISNAIDWKASLLQIEFKVTMVDGNRRLVIRLIDDGLGMSKDVLETSFWGLGYSTSRELKEKGETSLIGEKGHGTKIYLKSDKVTVRTKSKSGSYESYCENPFSNLSNHKLHEPKIKEIPDLYPGDVTGTEIEIIGYNDSQRSSFIQNVVKDYILWFTKAGSVEKEFGVTVNENFKVRLKCIGQNDFEEIQFGHPFPAECSDINQLFDEKGVDAADFYVKRFLYQNQRLTNAPEVAFDMIVSIEGDQVKRRYNPMIRERLRSDTGRYKVSDRYGVWICKDYIPVTRINDWISGFGTGSNSLTLVHAFVNCQELKLTANRGTFSNTDPTIIEELKEKIQKIFNDIDAKLSEKELLYTLRSWQKESRTLNQENSEFTRRIKSIKNRKKAIINERVFLEPQGESELFGFFISLYTLFPNLFSFEPLDYNTNNGIDIIARNTTDNTISESEFWYIELKFILKKDFNHAFEHLSWIVCWDFDKIINDDTEFVGVEDNDIRKLSKVTDGDTTRYFLDNRSRRKKIEIIRLKEFIKEKKGIEFKD